MWIKRIRGRRRLVPLVKSWTALSEDTGASLIAQPSDENAGDCVARNLSPSRLLSWKLLEKSPVAELYHAQNVILSLRP